MMSQEEYRLNCEIRYCIKLGVQKKLESYLELVEKHRGKIEADMLRRVARRCYVKGNRGNYGDDNGLY